MTVVDKLAGLAAGGGEAEAEDDVVQTALKLDQQVVAGLAGHTDGLLIVAAELLLQNAVDELDLLLLIELGGILGLLFAHLGVGVAGGFLFVVAHRGGADAQSLAALRDRLSVLSH